MEFRNINTFLCVAEMQSFSRAANKLGYSQSNVSFQIRQLEEELGVRLFERTGKTIQITEPGQDFLFYANEIQRLSDQAAASVKIPKGKGREALTGLLRIGSIESIATAIMPDLLAGFHRLYPQMQILVYTEGGRNILIDQVRNNQIDLFFDLNERMTIPSLKRELLRREEIVFLSGEPVASQKNRKLSLREIVKQDFVLTEHGEGYRNELDRLLAQYDLHIIPVIEFGNPETIIHLVERKIGLSFLPLFCAEEKVKSGQLFIVETDTPKIYMYSQIFYHKNKWITPQMQALLSFITHYFNTPNGASKKPDEC